MTSIVRELPVLYHSVQPLNRETHRGLRLKTLPEPLSFARGTHLLPAVMDEFGSAARELPILFLPEGEMITAVFVLSTRPGVNGFVDGDGLWTATYMPASMRRYPFLIGDVEGGDPVLCFDDQFEGLNESAGEALFGPDGQPSAALNEIVDFAGHFRMAGQRTAALVARLVELDLLKRVTLDITSRQAGATSLAGFMIVDETRLKGLSDAVTLELQRNGMLPAIQAHLMSLGALKTLI